MLCSCLFVKRTCHIEKKRFTTRRTAATTRTARRMALRTASRTAGRGLAPRPLIILIQLCGKTDFYLIVKFNSNLLRSTSCQMFSRFSSDFRNINQHLIFWKVNSEKTCSSSFLYKISEKTYNVTQCHTKN